MGTPAVSSRTAARAASCSTPSEVKVTGVPGKPVRVPLFTVDELAAAFALVLSKERASALARRWFEMFVDDAMLDTAGRYVYTDRVRDPRTPEALRVSPIVIVSPPQLPASAGMYDWILSMPQGRLEERLLSFSDVHLDLFAVSSTDGRARVDRLRQGEPPEFAERRYRELERVIGQITK